MARERGGITIHLLFYLRLCHHESPPVIYAWVGLVEKGSKKCEKVLSLGVKWSYEGKKEWFGWLVRVLSIFCLYVPKNMKVSIYGFVNLNRRHEHNLFKKGVNNITRHVTTLASLNFKSTLSEADVCKCVCSKGCNSGLDCLLYY